MPDGMIGHFPALARRLAGQFPSLCERAIPSARDRRGGRQTRGAVTSGENDKTILRRLIPFGRCQTANIMKDGLTPRLWGNV
jgi:hypothetical protein